MKLHHTLSILVLAAGLGGAELPHAAPAEVGLSQERLDRITRTVEQDIEQGQLAGAVAVIARKGRIAYWQTFGMADRESDRPMQDDTVFRIYSMTKPIVGVALMTLYEEGRFALRDPVGRHLPALGGVRVMQDGQQVPQSREMTVQDLLRHTAGMTYGLFGSSPVDELYTDANLLSDNESVEHFVGKLAKLPLKHQPGSAWDYSVSVDVQGRLIEVLSGMDLDDFLEERIFRPLDMRDTSFHIPEESEGRFVQMYQKTEDETAIEPAPADRSQRYYDRESRWFSGGGGLVSTTRDYLRFCQMMLNWGELEGTRILSRKTVELMTIDHVADVRRASPILASGYGFGLGFAVHVDPSASGLNGSVGEYNWGGLAGTSFWIDPVEEMIGLYMIQLLPPRFEDTRTQFKRLAYQAIVDRAGGPHGVSD